MSCIVIRSDYSKRTQLGRLFNFCFDLQVVQRIRALPSETRLLVVDAAAEAFYRDRDIVITGQMEDVEYRSSGDGGGRNSSSNNRLMRDLNDGDRNSVESANSNASSAGQQHQAYSNGRETSANNKVGE